MRLFKKKKWKQKKGWITVEEVEEKSGVKLTYPNQQIPGSADEEKYKELVKFGCSDVWDEKGTWIHRDCFSRKCMTCNYYPILKKYEEENNINHDAPADFTKAFEIMKNVK